jgi:putative DNA primase/helicase
VDALTLQTATPYEPDALCPRWQQFVSEIFGGDDTLNGFIQRGIGYSLTGVTTEQCLFMDYGTGANGKGTMTNTLKRVLGDYAWNMPFTTIELKDRSGIPNDLAALVNRRFVIASETNDGSRLNEARVKYFRVFLKLSLVERKPGINPKPVTPVTSSRWRMK